MRNLYVNRCACGHHGETHHDGESHNSEIVTCDTCGEPVELERDGGVTLIVAEDCPPVPLGHLIREDRATTALDLYGLALRGANLSSSTGVESLAGLLDQARETLAEFAGLPLNGNDAVLDAAIRRGLWDEGLRALHDQLLGLPRQRQAGA